VTTTWRGDACDAGAHPLGGTVWSLARPDGARFTCCSMPCLLALVTGERSPLWRDPDAEDARPTGSGRGIVRLARLRRFSRHPPEAADDG
jgi:hypothetical protein